jgi:Amt family ammonium transporter
MDTIQLQRSRAGRALIALGLSLSAIPLAFAQEAVEATAPAAAPAAAPVAAAASAINSGDVAWMLASAALVLLMTPALGFFYGGMVRAKNVVSTIFQSFVAVGLVTLIWYAFGYSLAFSPGSAWLGGLGWSFFESVGGAPNADYAATIPHSLFAIYQCMFAVITPALIAGAFGERMKFSAYTLFIALWSLVVYSPVAHWVWGVGGALRGWGVLDFAGGTVVHQTAGFSALAAALVFGKRTDYGKADYSPSSIPLIAIGTGLLWFGWFGFNGGSALASNELATSAFIATHLGAAAAGLAWVVMDRILKGKANLTGFCVGAVVGLVAITPASGFVGAGSAIVVGAAGAVAANLVAYFRGKSQLDDSLDVFACHGVGGFVGTVLTGVFCSKAINSAGADASAAQFLTQVKGSLVVAVWSFGATFVLLKVINAVLGLRPTAADEAKGMDATDHGEKAYIA